jgi:hypothetical protein
VIFSYVLTGSNNAFLSSFFTSTLKTSFLSSFDSSTVSSCFSDYCLGKNVFYFVAPKLLCILDVIVFDDYLEGIYENVAFFSNIEAKDFTSFESDGAASLAFGFSETLSTTTGTAVGFNSFAPNGFFEICPILTGSAAGNLVTDFFMGSTTFLAPNILGIDNLEEVFSTYESFFNGIVTDFFMGSTTFLAPNIAANAFTSFVPVSILL